MKLFNNKVEVTKCMFNSDVLPKAAVKVIEAVQTKNVMTIFTTVISVYPSVVDECKKCLGEE